MVVPIWFSHQTDLWFPNSYDLKNMFPDTAQIEITQDGNYQERSSTVIYVPCQILLTKGTIVTTDTDGGSGKGKNWK
jgi:hypothetical protein